MPKIKLSEVVKGVDCFVGSKSELTGQDNRILTNNTNLVKECISKVPESLPKLLRNSLKWHKNHKI